MKNSIPLLLFAFIVPFTACVDNGTKVKSTSLTDTLEVWADTSLHVLINEQRKAFENAYTNPILQISYTHESRIIERLMSDKLNCAILQRNLTPNEAKYLAEKEDFVPKQYVVAYDAFVFIVNKDHPVKALSVQDIRDYFNKKGTINYQLVFESNHCQAIPYFQSYFNLSGGQILSAFSKSNLDELLGFIRNDKNSIGIIPFSYISDIGSTATIDLLKDLKVMEIQFTDSTGKLRSVNPSQESITTRDYPFVAPIVLLNCNMEKKSGTTFVNYLLKPKAQRLFMKCGVVPAVFPTREVKVNIQ